MSLQDYIVPTSDRLPDQYYEPPRNKYNPLGYVQRASSGVSGAIAKMLIVLIVVAIIAVIVYYIWYPKILVKELIKKHWILIIKEDNDDCDKQLDILDIETYPYTVTCRGVSSDSPLCAGVKSFPTWYNKRTKNYIKGPLTKKQLVKLID
jgi:hypothetical protein